MFQLVSGFVQIYLIDLNISYEDAGGDGDDDDGEDGDGEDDDGEDDGENDDGDGDDDDYVVVQVLLYHGASAGLADISGVDPA